MSMRATWVGLAALLCVGAGAAFGGEPENELLAAARRGDAVAVKTLLTKGANVNAKFRYGTTALFPACDKGHIEVVKVLLEHGADVNVKDTFYSATALTWAAMNDRTEIIGLLLDKGAEGAENILAQAVVQGKTEVVRAVVARGKLKPEALTSALVNAKSRDRKEIIDILEKAGATPPKEDAVKVPAELLLKYAGTYRNDSMGLELTFSVKAGKLVGLQMQSGQEFTLSALDQQSFTVVELGGINLKFNVEGEKATSITITQSGAEFVVKRVEGK